MQYDLPVESRIVRVVATLKEAGFETYIVGGAIRDLLLERSPKDYDISTAARPEQIVQVFGRRYARIIGKRFRLVHLRLGEDILEISTFRSAPDPELQKHKNEEDPDNLITSDNDFGTAQEDAFRRDFTINALFYDPVTRELVDHTGLGVADIQNKIVRAIGNPALRFEEDPVRMLRALKLVGQYDCELESTTENALFECLPLIEHASLSRLSLELEKILASSYGDKHLCAFYDYGFLDRYLPFFAQRWDSESMGLALDLLTERNIRVLEGCYRNSISLAMAVLLYPFVEEEIAAHPEQRPGTIIRDLVDQAFLPQMMVKKLLFSAERVLGLFCMMRRAEKTGRLPEQKGYPHARELLLIHDAVVTHDDSLIAKWPPRFETRGTYRRPPRRTQRQRQ